MLRKISVGIDVGTFQIKIVVSEEIKQDDGSYCPKIIATGYAESKGMRHGYIINSEDIQIIANKYLQDNKLYELCVGKE